MDFIGHAMEWTTATPLPNTSDCIFFGTSCFALVSLYHSLVYAYKLDPAHPTSRPTAGQLEKGGKKAKHFVVGNLGESQEKAEAHVLDAEKKANACGLKIRSWITTAASSLVMTIASFPFLLDLIHARGDISLLLRREELARPLVVFFMAYLVVDCTLGWNYYRSQFNVLTGWVHHSAYLLLLSMIMRVGCCHVFALAAVMELPTLVLALGMIFPSLRHDMIFTVLFFLTRILAHGLFIALYSSPFGRLHGALLYSPTGTPIVSLVPIIGLVSASPLHIIWFTGSVRGMLKRSRNSKRSKVVVGAASAVVTPAPIPTISITSPSTPLLPPSSPTTEKPKTFLFLNRPTFVSLASSATSYLASGPPFPRPSQFPIRRPFLKPNTRAAILAHTIEKDVRDFFDRNVKIARAWKVVNDLEEMRMSLEEIRGNFQLGGNGALENEDDIIKALERRYVAEQTLHRLRERAGEGGKGLRRFGGRLRRRVGDAVMAL